MSLPTQINVRNGILAALPYENLAGLWPKLTPVVLAARQKLYAPGGPIDFVYFPEDGMISLVSNLADGMQAEVGIVGRESMLGTSAAFGVNTSFPEAMVQMPGTGLRMSARDLREEVETNAPLRTLLQHSSEALQAQVMQTAACNGRHGLEQRLARWLLMAHDRSKGDALSLTQDFVATMLAVHRPSITVTAGILQRAGLIQYSGGRITILDRTGLEASSCECYAAVQQRFATLLGGLAGEPSHGLHLGTAPRYLDLAAERLEGLLAENADLRAQARRARLMLDSAVDYAILSLDCRGTILSANHGARRILGYDDAELIGRSFATLLAVEDQVSGRFAEGLALALRHGRTVNEGWHVRRDGVRLWASGSTMPMVGEDGVAEGFVVILRDQGEVHAEGERRP